MPGKTPESACRRRRAIRLSRSSSFTRRVRKRSSEKALRRNSPSVPGTDMREPPNTFLDYTRDSGLRASAIGLRLIGHVVTFGWPKPEARKPKPVVNEHARCRQLFPGQWRRGASWEL